MEIFQVQTFVIVIEFVEKEEADGLVEEIFLVEMSYMNYKYVWVVHFGS